MNAKNATAVRLTYLLPFLLALLFLISACLPHLFYQYNLESSPEISGDLSLFELLGNTFEKCFGFLKGNVQGSTSEFYFSIVMMVFWTLSWISVVLYALFSAATALMCVAVWTPTPSPTKQLNTLKKCYRILVPNRGFYVFYQILPLIPSVFPYLLQTFYRSMLSIDATVYYYVLPTPILAAVLCAVSITCFFLTRRAQDETKMDLFRLYRSGK